MGYSKIKRKQKNIVELKDRQTEDSSRYWETGREEWTFGTERQEGPETGGESWGTGRKEEPLLGWETERQGDRGR
jgi:hypothetical protein